MNSDFDVNELSKIISTALDDSPTPIDRQYGQLGFMESQVIQSIFQAFEDRIGQTDLINIIKDSRIPSLSVQNSLKITDLHTVTHNCRKCSFSGITPELPKWNVTNPDVMFITSSAYIDQQASALFVAMLKATGFTSEKVCLTYLLRCPTRNVEQQYIDNCSHYLHNEIQIMNPKLIVPLGADVLSALFGTELKIKEYKGKITWLGSWPIFPIYSIAYILKAGASAEEDFKADMLQAYQFCYNKGS
jgi:uracil-DNA glycosylase family 4